MTHYKEQQHELFTDTVQVITSSDTITENSKIRILEKQDTIYTKVHMPAELQEGWKTSEKESGREIILNLYDLIILTLETGFDYTLLPFNLMLIFAVLQLIMAFNNRANAVFNLALFSVIIAIFYLLSLVTFMFQDVSQIKYGYYLYLINTIAILALSKKLTENAL